MVCRLAIAEKSMIGRARQPVTQSILRDNEGRVAATSALAAAGGWPLPGAQGRAPLSQFHLAAHKRQTAVAGCSAANRHKIQ